MSISLITDKNTENTEKKEIEIRVTAMNITSEVYGRLYDLHVKPIYRFVYFKVNSREEAEDLTSETFLKAWDYISKSNKANQIRNLRAFFYQVASNLVVDFYRKKSLFPVPMGSLENNIEPLDDKETCIEKMEKEVEISEVRQALKNIPENYGDIVIWYYLEDLKISEIAQIIEKTEGAVRVLIHRALKSLKRELEKIDKEKKLLIQNRENGLS